MRPYQALRNELYINGIGYANLARSLRVCESTISRKMNAEFIFCILYMQYIEVQKNKKKRYIEKSCICPSSSVTRPHDEGIVPSQPTERGAFFSSV